MKSMKCTCMPNNVVWFVVQSLVFAFGVIALLRGVQNVWVMGFSWPAVIWIALGFFVVAMGKLMKTKTHHGCPMYG